MCEWAQFLYRGCWWAASRPLFCLLMFVFQPDMSWAALQYRTVVPSLGCWMFLDSQKPSPLAVCGGTQEKIRQPSVRISFDLDYCIEQGFGLDGLIGLFQHHYFMILYTVATISSQSTFGLTCFFPTSSSAVPKLVSLMRLESSPFWDNISSPIKVSLNPYSESLSLSHNSNTVTVNTC